MKRAADESGEDSVGSGERTTRSKRCQATPGDVEPSRASAAALCNVAPATAALLPAAASSFRENIQENVARELALYQTQSPVVVNAVLKHHQGRLTCDPSVYSAMTLFEASIRNGDLETVRLLVENGVHVEAKIGSDLEPFPVHAACKHGQLEILQLLVSCGARANVRSETLTQTSLSIACLHGHVEIVKWLIENSVLQDMYTDLHPVVRGPLQSVWCFSFVGISDALGGAALTTAVMHGKLRILKCLAESNLPSLAAEGSLLSHKLLKRSTRQENVGMVRYLLGLGVFSQKEVNECLRVATKLQNIEIVKLLVSKGANLDAFTDVRRETSLFQAIRHNMVDMAKALLLLGADVNKPANWSEYSAIHSMASFGRLEMLTLVRQICGDAADFKAPNRRERDTPLHMAAAFGRVEVVRFLLDALAPDVDIDVETRYDDTPLSIAAKNGHLDVVRLLVAEGAAINNEANDGGSTALFCAAECGQFDVVRFLCENGANVLWRRFDGVSSLCIAARNGSVDIVEYLAEVCSADLNAVTFDLTALNEAVIHGRTDVLRVLLAHNANTRDDGERRSNLLCQAIVYNRADIAHLLVKYGADANAVYRMTVNDVELEVTPLLVAAGCGNLKLVKFLCACGADVEGASNEDETALFFAATFGKLDVVEYLVSQQNANVQSTNSYGFTPAEAATTSCYAEVVRCLARYGGIPLKRNLSVRYSLGELSNAEESPLLEAGTLASDATYICRRAAADVLLIGNFLR